MTSSRRFPAPSAAPRFLVRQPRWSGVLGEKAQRRWPCASVGLGLSHGVLGGVDSGDRCATTLAHEPDKHFRAQVSHDGIHKNLEASSP